MDIETFIRRWQDREGGAERANATMYLLELTQALDLPPPDPAGADTAHNDYVFERAVRSPFRDAGPPNRIDLYKRGCFVLEAKQSRWAPRRDGAWRAPPDGRWDAMMRRARAQAHGYVALLPADHPAPPFLIVCDVARQFEIWADFSGTGRGYAPFPDRAGFRIAHDALAEPEVQNRLRAIWTAPQRLAPALTLHHLGADGCGPCGPARSPRLRRPCLSRPAPDFGSCPSTLPPSTPCPSATATSPWRSRRPWFAPGRLWPHAIWPAGSAAVGARPGWSAP